MPLVVETGAGLPDADSYASIEQASSYFTSFGFPSWAAGAVGDQEAALRRSTTYIDLAFASRWPGERTNGRVQALAWPRANVVSSSGVPIAPDEVPREVVAATLEVARREFARPFSLMPSQPPTAVKRSVSVGPISVQYADAQGRTWPPALDTIEALLREVLLDNDAYFAWLERA